MSVTHLEDSRRRQREEHLQEKQKQQQKQPLKQVPKFLRKKDLEAKLLQDVNQVLNFHKLVKANAETEQEKQAAQEKETKSLSLLVYSDTSKDLLHTYNEVKDAAQALLGFIAMKRDCTLKEVYESFGLDVNQD